MATPTPNLGLVKPDMSDEIDQSIPAIATNFGTIDTATGKLANLTTVDKSSLVSAISENANGLAAQKADVVQRGINVKSAPYNAKGDGVTDDTAAITAAIAAGNGIYLPDGDTFLVSGLLIDSKSTFSIFGKGKLKLKDSSIIQLVKFNNCTNIFIPFLNLDGNVAGNGVTVNEAIATLALYDCSNVVIGDIYSKNPAGDCVYLNNVNDFQINSIIGTADTYTGRNALSIIKAQRGQIGRVESYKIGHSSMPTGIDLEPNAAGDTITDITIGELICDSAGSGGFTIANTVGATVSRISINSAIINKNSAASTTLNAGQVLGASHVKIGYLYAKFTTASGTGLRINNSTYISANVDIENAVLGVTLGETVAVSHITLTGRIISTTQHNIVIYICSDSLIDMNLKNPGAAYLNINKSGTGTCNNIEFRGDFSKGSTGTTCFFTSAASGVTNWVLNNVDFTGWAIGSRFAGAAFQGNVKKINCRNLNFATSVPNFDLWSIGDIIYNTAPTLLKNISHWTCITAGTPGSWTAHGCGTGTTANRPTLGTKDQGYQYRDTTTGTFVYWDGSSWI